MEAYSTTASRLSKFLLMIPFLCFYYVQLVHHVLWRDEYNVWGIVCVSKTFSEMLARVHYEAHPALWYVICYEASKISQSGWMLKTVQGVIGTAIYWMLALTTPFRRLELALILGGYYISFQTTVMCRMYGLEVLFALIYIWFRMNHPEWMVRNVVWLGLIANVDTTAGILSLGLLCEYLWERYQYHRSTKTLRLTPFAFSIVAYVALVAVSIASLWPAKDIGWAATGRIFSQFDDLDHLGSAMAKWTGVVFFPQTSHPVSMWFEPQPWPHALIAPLVVSLYFLVFRKQGRLGLMLIGISAMGILFSHATTVAGIRHIAVAYIAFIIALWIMRYRNDRVSSMSYVLLGLTVVATFYNIADQWGKPFADDDAAAQFVLKNHLEDLPMLGTPEPNIIGLPERLHRPVYQLQCDCFDRVMTFSNQRTDFPDFKDLPGHLVKAVNTLNAPTGLFIDNRPLAEEEIRSITLGNIGVTKIAAFDKGYLGDEHFYLYRLTAERHP